MKKILLATTNNAKKKELQETFSHFSGRGVKIISLSDLNAVPEPEETGKTFEENSILKAKYYGDFFQIPTIADDGGLMIDALGGEPGVLSRRWKGYEGTDRELIDYALLKLEGIKEENRSAKLQTCLCFYDPKSKKQYCVEKNIEGYISEAPCTYETNGYPYRALFIVKKYSKYYDALTQEEHADVNHRHIAAKILSAWIIKNMLQ